MHERRTNLSKFDEGSKTVCAGFHDDDDELAVERVRSVSARTRGARRGSSGLRR